MKKQFAVFGLGSFGESIALELQKLGCEVVAVDKDMERVNGIADSVSSDGRQILRSRIYQISWNKKSGRCCDC